MSEMYKGFCAKYPVVSIEDPFEQDQWEVYTKFTADNSECQVVGDDLLVTNPKRVKKGVDLKAANALLLKVLITQYKSLSILMHSEIRQ